MTGLPNFGDRVRIWPHPDRANVADGPAPMTTAGALHHRVFLRSEGKEVVWSDHHLEQLKQGDIFLHDPNPRTAPSKPAEKKE